MQSPVKARRFHPLAEQFPPMADPEFAALVADLRQNGLQEPIKIDARGRIVDGRNRYLAARKLSDEYAKLPPKDRSAAFERLQYQEEKVKADEAYVNAMNLARRHLSPSQKCLYIARYLMHDDKKRRRKVNVRELAERYGVAHPTLYKASYVVTESEKASEVWHGREKREPDNPEDPALLPERVLRGELSVGKAEQRIAAVLERTAKPKKWTPTQAKQAAGRLSRKIAKLADAEIPLKVVELLRKAETLLDAEL